MKPSLRFVTAVALVAVGAGISTVPVGAAPSRTAAARPSVRLAGPRVAALDALRHLARPTTAAGVVAWHGAEARARATLAGTGLTGVTVGTPSGQEAIDLPVAGSGGDDVLVLTLPDTRPSSLSLRSGRTGATKWTVKLADAWSLDVARLGPSRRPAAVVYQTAFTGTGPSDPTGLEDSGDQDNSVVVVDLATGKTDWTSTVIHGGYTASDAGFSEAAALYPAGVLHDKAGDRLLGALVTQSFGIAGSALAQQPVAFDGATGAMTPLGQSTASDAFGYLEPAGDLNGDGMSDVIQVVSGDSSAVVVDSGAAGQPLWAKPTVPAFFVDAAPVPDLDGDHYNDVLVSDDGGPTSADGIITAYAGSGGATLWTRTGDYAIPLGVAAGRGVVGVFGGLDQVSMEGVAGKGTTLWHRDISIPIGGSGGWEVELGASGDVDGDGVQDLFADVMYTGSGGSGHFVSIVSGRTGSVHSGAPIGNPLYGSLDGHGDDFLQATTTGAHSVTLAGYDGNTRHRLWKMTLSTAGIRPFVVGADAVTLSGRGHGLVLDIWDGTRTIVVAIGGRSGHRLWTQNI